MGISPMRGVEIELHCFPLSSHVLFLKLAKASSLMLCYFPCSLELLSAHHTRAEDGQQEGAAASAPARPC